MLSIGENTTINKTNSSNKKTYKISENTINQINSILSLDSQDEVINKVNNFKNNGKIIYKNNSSNIHKKKYIISIILENISKLLNQLNINRVYNNTSYISNTKNQGYSKTSDLKKMLIINGTKLYKSNIKGIACNEWVEFIYNLLLDITNNDKDIKYIFQINTNDAHGILYIQVGEKKYSFDSTTSGFTFEEIDKDKIKAKKKHKPVIFDNYKEYKENSINYMNKKNNIVYDFNGKKFKLLIKGGLIFIGYKTKPINYINVTGLKRLTKNISKISNIKYVGITPKLHNIDQIKEFILSKISKTDKNDVKIILEHIEEEKLLSFFKLTTLKNIY